MPGCAAINCSNSAIKGYLMKHFPRDPERRKEWVNQMRRDKWSPTNHSCLCEVHFAPEMWEKPREDGTRKLRCNAVPTIFSFTKQKNARKSIKQKNVADGVVEQVLEDANVPSEVSGPADQVVEGALEPIVIIVPVDELFEAPNVPSETAFSQPLTSTVAPSITRSISIEEKKSDNEGFEAANVPSETASRQLLTSTVASCITQSTFINEKESGSEVSDTANVPSETAFCQLLTSTVAPSIMQSMSIVKKEYDSEVFEAANVPIETASCQLLASTVAPSIMQPISIVNKETDSPILPENSIQVPNQAELLARLERYEKMYLKERSKAARYKNLLRNAQRKIVKLEQNDSFKPCHSSDQKHLLNPDQVTALKKKQAGKSTKFMKWSKETVAKSLELKLTCGNNGYKNLLKQSFPLPSVRTLQRRLRDSKFNSQILHET